MKKKILYIGGFELPDKNAAAHRVLTNAKAFRDLEYEVSFIGVTHKNINARYIKQSTIDNFKHYAERYPKTLRDWFLYITNISHLLDISEFRDANIIIAYNLPAIKLYKLCNYCRKSNKKIIADCTEWYMPFQDNILRKCIKFFDTEFRMRFVHFKLDGLIVISDFLENYYKSKVRRIVNLPPLIDFYETKWLEENFVQKKIVDPLTLIYAGSPGKGNKDRLDYIITALDEVSQNPLCRKVEFTIVGITETQYCDIFDVKLNIKSDKLKVLFLGRLSHLETLHVLKKSDYQFFTRDNNIANIAGFPTKFVESTTAGIPVITNSTSDLNRYIAECNGYLVDLNQLEKELLIPLSRSPKEIEVIKEKINKSMFDYRNYLNKINGFLSKFNY